MVIKDSGLRKDRHVVWECKCACGKKTLTSSSDLLRGHTQSCGCLNKERVVESNKTIHPNYTVDYPRLWKQWDDMIRRCENPKTLRYHRYGGRGISVCDEWHDFKTYMDWAMSHGYQEDLQIDRIDNDGDYCPDNCRFVTNKENCRNMSTNHNITIDGETRCLTEWSELTDTRRSVINWWCKNKGEDYAIEKLKERLMES